MFYSLLVMVANAPKKIILQLAYHVLQPACDGCQCAQENP